MISIRGDMAYLPFLTKSKEMSSGERDEDAREGRRHDRHHSSSSQTMIRPSFIARVLFPEEKDKIWVDHCKERVLERLLGGTGDSCVVSLLKVSIEREDSDLHERKRRRRRRLEEKGYIVKRVKGPSQRHYGYDALKTEIKRMSYKVEGEFLMAANRCQPQARIPFVIANARYWEDESKYTSLLIEDDLVAKGFHLHFGEVEESDAVKAIEWLARFHSFKCWSGKERVWSRGGYWSLDKRTEEYRRIRARWKDCLKNDGEDGEYYLDKLPVNLAVRLELSAHGLDQVLFPSTKFPFTDRDERDAYGTQLNDDEEDNQSADEQRRDRFRTIFAKNVEQDMVCALGKPPIQARNTCIFLDSTLIHGDYKAENLFFSESECAVCDFQWVGFGLGVLDIVSFVYSSLIPKIASLDFIDRLLDQYCESMRKYAQDPPASSFASDRRMLGWLFDWALVDYSRYVVGSGLVFPEDAKFLQRVDQILARVDGGFPLESIRVYTEAIHDERQRLMWDLYAT